MPAISPAADRTEAAPKAAASAPGADDKNPLLVALGERVRALRSRRGMTRRALAAAADVSERHLANLEYGIGNASILVLRQVANALHCSLAELLGDVTTSSPEWLLIRELLERRDEDTLRRVRVAMAQMLGTGAGGDAAAAARRSRIALVGLRGAGKSTLGRMLGDDLGWPFVELSREIEKFAGCSVAEIQALYGQNAYRRYERRALEEAIQIYPEAVIATPGGIVSDAATFNILLGHCTTIWLEATPEDHMNRVIDQGDTRPMGAAASRPMGAAASRPMGAAASRPMGASASKPMSAANKRAMSEAMDDLRSILAGRRAFYSKADYALNTSTQDLAATYRLLRAVVAEHIEDPGAGA